MGLKTTQPTPSKAVGRKAKVKELEQKHTRLFKLENLVTTPKFIPKMAYVPKSGDERVISFFPSEIMGGQDIYTEFVSRALIPEDSERRLWKWHFNPEYDSEYVKTDPHPATGHQQYLIPVAELIDVAKQHVEVKKKPEKESENAQTELELETTGNELAHVKLNDAPLVEMTIKDRAAIEWKQPVSDKPWLNELIKQTFNLK